MFFGGGFFVGFFVPSWWALSVPVAVAVWATWVSGVEAIPPIVMGLFYGIWVAVGLRWEPAHAGGCFRRGRRFVSGLAQRYRDGAASCSISRDNGYPTMEACRPSACGCGALLVLSAAPNRRSGAFGLSASDRVAAAGLVRTPLATPESGGPVFRNVP